MRLLVDALPYHDCVVDDDTQHQQEGECTQYVQRNIIGWQQGKRAHESYTNTRRHPQGNLRSQRQNQYNEDQQQPKIR